MTLGSARAGFVLLALALAGCGNDPPARGTFPKIPDPEIIIEPTKDQGEFADEFKGREIWVYKYVGGIVQCRVKVENTDADGKTSTKEFGPIAIKSAPGLPPSTRGQIVIVPPTPKNRSLVMILTGMERRVAIKESAEKFRVTESVKPAILSLPTKLTTVGETKELASWRFSAEIPRPKIAPRDQKGSAGPETSKFSFIVEWISESMPKK